MTTEPKVAVSIENFLPISGTFIYRQLNGVSLNTKPIVLTSNLKHTDLFPYKYVYAKKPHQVEQVVMKLEKIFRGKFKLASRSQRSVWREAILRHNINLIHAHFGPDALQVLPLAQELCIPLLVSFHGYDASSLLRNDKYVRAMKDVFEYANIIAVSENMKLRLEKHGANSEKINVLYYGIPVEEFRFVKRKSLKEKYKNNEEIIFLQVSNFVEKKGHKYTLLALAEFLKSNPNVKLLLAGDGVLKDKMMQLAKQLKISNNVDFLGKVDQSKVIELMSKSDVFLHHSIVAESGDQEGIPNVIMEAMASGLPVISTYHSGIPELIEDGKNGFLVNEKDVESYTKKVNDVLNCHEKISKNARSTIERKFNMTVQNMKLCEYYHKFAKSF